MGDLSPSTGVPDVTVFIVIVVEKLLASSLGSKLGD